MNLATIDQSAETAVPRSWHADAEVSACFRSLYRRLLAEPSSGDPVRLVGFTSCHRGEGVSTVANRLAVAAAEDGAQKVLLVDLSYEAVSIGQTLADDQAAELFNVTRGLDSLEQFMQPSSWENLWLLPLGAIFASSPRVEQPLAPREVLRALADEFSFIVVDMPPLDEVSATTAVDGIVLVVEAEQTTPTLIRAAKDALPQGRLLGAVLNKRQAS